MSWMELACFIALKTARAYIPTKTSFLAAAAITKQLWNSLVRFFEVVDDCGSRVPLKKFVPTMKNAGASITCGIPNEHGIARRVICNDHPGFSIGIAVLLRWAHTVEDRLHTTIPAYRWCHSDWAPSGMLQTLEQLREFRRKACITPAKPKVDLCQWKKRRLANQHCNKLTGPCVCGCALPSTSSSARVRWHTKSQALHPGLGSTAGLHYAPNGTAGVLETHARRCVRLHGRGRCPEWEMP